MRKYQERNPSNARVFIDFKDKKNPVRFEYPNKKSAFKVIYWTLFSIWTKIILLFIIFNLFFIAYQCQVINSFPLTTIILSVLSSLPIVPAIFSIIGVRSKKFLSMMPKINMKLALFSGASYKETIIDNLKEKAYELPIFENVFLHYKTYGDYGRYLEKIEVTEHNFYYVEESIFRKKLKEKQDNYWKVRFYFSRIPKSGKFVVTWI